ncbi:MAG: FISUMP domain-containing protein [Fibrobacterota bacterium]
MKTNSYFAAALMSAACGFSGTLSGTILNPDSTGRAGVVIKLASTGDTASTKSDGSWSIATAYVDAVLPRSSAGRQMSGHLILQGPRLHLSLDGRDLVGRQFPSDRRTMSNPTTPLGRLQASEPDTLIYTWNGKTILRDTLTALSQGGIVRTFDTTVNAKITYGYATDVRDGRVYRTVKVGDKFWTTQNANYAADSSWCYGGIAANCHTYGRLYQWHAAIGAIAPFDANLWSGATTSRQGACPAQWHVPTYTEWNALFAMVGGQTGAARRLKSAFHWSQPGIDSIGFQIRPSGYMVDLTGTFSQIGNYTYFWTVTETSTTRASAPYFYTSANANFDLRSKPDGYALRCVQN